LERKFKLIRQDIEVIMNIRTIEEIALNAWPSLQTIMYDGWILRFANGYTKRANSINPIYDSTINVEEKILTCEQIYRSKNLPVVFKMTSDVYPNNLDIILDEHGYQIDSRTSVQTMDLINELSSEGAELENTLTEEWLAGFCRLNNIGEDIKSTLRQIFINIAPQKCFAVIRRQDRGIAYGLSVLQTEYIGFYDIFTDASFRNQGFGKRLMSCLLNWGKQNGARKAYLQVLVNNESALQLYSQLGFQENYQYWYRIKR
jgi:N-acetylglutamate synthase